jgi:hypothetical protein
LLKGPQAIAQLLHLQLHRVSYRLDRCADTLRNLRRRETLEIRELQRVVSPGGDGAGAKTLDSPFSRDGEKPGGFAASRRLE